MADPPSIRGKPVVYQSDDDFRYYSNAPWPQERLWKRRRKRYTLAAGRLQKQIKSLGDVSSRQIVFCLGTDPATEMVPVFLGVLSNDKSSLLLPDSGEFSRYSEQTISGQQMLLTGRIMTYDSSWKGRYHRVQLDLGPDLLHYFGLKPKQVAFDVPSNGWAQEEIAQKLNILILTMLIRLKRGVAE